MDSWQHDSLQDKAQDRAATSHRQSSTWNYNILATLLGEVQDSWHLQS